MDSLTTQLAEKLSKVGVKTSYGEPIEMQGATIIPVAIASFGFGAGEADHDVKLESSGSGGGGGGFSIPVGAYITRNGTTNFEPNPIALLAVCVPLVTATGFTVARIIKAFKK